MFQCAKKNSHNSHDKEKSDYLMIVLTIFAGITHSDELIYLYPRVGNVLNEEDTKIAKLMVQIFGNFITSGYAYKQ
jgi:hypothetical protein